MNYHEDTQEIKFEELTKEQVETAPKLWSANLASVFAIGMKSGKDEYAY